MFFLQIPFPPTQKQSKTNDYQSFKNIQPSDMQKSKVQKKRVILLIFTVTTQAYTNYQMNIQSVL